MLTRRDFLKLCLSSSALSLSGLLLPKVVEALDQRGEKVTILWLELMTCSGDLLSFANTLRPDLEQLIRDTIRLEFQNTLMAAEGEVALHHLYDVAQQEEGNYVLVAEGTVPTRDHGVYGKVGYFGGGKAITDIEALKFLGPRAKYVIAIGSCAAFGGPYAASPNPSGSRPVHKILKGIQVINVPGCPAHPDWFVGTLSHVILYGVPELDAFGRPTMFYKNTIHDYCPKRQHFENGIFAKHPGDEGCLFQIGCKGPVTYSDCPTRQWNSAHLNWPIGANTPCIGCASPEFPDRMSPFFEHLGDFKSPLISVKSSLAGKIALGAAGAGIAGHVVASSLTGRLHRHLVDGSEASNITEGILEYHSTETEGEASPEVEDVEFADELASAEPPVAKAGKISAEQAPFKLALKRAKKLEAKKIKPHRRGGSGGM